MKVSERVENVGSGHDNSTPRQITLFSFKLEPVMVTSETLKPQKIEIKQDRDR